jgi:EmrB/QacA subfamily drug resistance transporter
MLNAENRRWWVLIAMTGSLAMIMIDTTVVSVALPSIQRDLQVSQTGVQWIVNAYVLVLAVTVALAGRLGDLVGHVKAFVGGVVVFALASAACGLAPNEPAIIAGRAVQGLGAAFMQPASAALVTGAFALRERGKAMAVYAGVATAFLALGPLLGGAVTEYASWRWVFWINLPVAAAAVALTLFVRPTEPAVPRQTIHVGHALLLVVGAAGLVVALQQAQDWGWTSPLTVGGIGGGLVLRGVFWATQLRTPSPLVDPGLFRERSFSADAIIVFCARFAMTVAPVFGAIYLQHVLGFSPMVAGLALLPQVLPVTVVIQCAGRVFDRVGVRLPVLVGTALLALGLILQAALLPRESYAWIVPGMCLLGLGIAAVMGPCNTDALNRAPAILRGEASGVMWTVQQMGSAVGLAAAGTLVGALEQAKIAAIVAGAGGSAASQARLSGLLAQATEEQAAAARQVAADWPNVLAALRQAVAESIAAGYFLAGGVVLVAFLVAVFVMQPGRQQAEVGTLEHVEPSKG